MDLILSALRSPGPELIQLGPFSLRWYGLLIAMSVLIGLNLSTKIAISKGLRNGLVNDLLPLLIINSIIGARIYYVIFAWQNYFNDNFWGSINILNYNIPIPRMIEIWEGGIAIHGALIAGLITIILFCKYNNQSFWEVLDVLVPSFALGQAIGRWGNFFNSEAFGTPTNLPWKLYIPASYRPEVFLSERFFHPTFLYESLWNIILFALLIYLYKSSKTKQNLIKPGTLSCVYLVFYSIGRGWIEGLRTDPLCLGGLPPFCEGGIRIAQLVSALLVIGGITGLWRIYKLKKRLPDPSKIKRRIT